YSRIHAIFKMVNEPKTLRIQLSAAVRDKYRLATLNSVRHWAAMNLNVIMPDSTVFDDNDPDHPEAGTYDRESFYELLILAVALGLMVPIWGEYIDRVQHTAAAAQKEQAAFELLRDA